LTKKAINAYYGDYIEKQAIIIANKKAGSTSSQL
jgi:hypothetical protein